MSLFVVDSARCKGDGICVAECPTRIIELTPENGTPNVPTGSEEFCRNCGHCVAVCPQGAVSLATMAPEQLVQVQPEWRLGREQVTHFLRARRSIRTFTPKPADRGVLADLIDIARFAPTASNRQPVRWVVVEEGDEVRRLAGLVVEWMRAGLPNQALAVRKGNERFISLWDAGRDVICRGAPHLIVACGPEAVPVSATDCVIALTYLELAAPSFGLGACWAGFFTAAARQWAPLKEALPLPDGHIVCGAMMVGYPRYQYYRLPLRNEAHITWHRSTH